MQLFFLYFLSIRLQLILKLQFAKLAFNKILTILIFYFMNETDLLPFKRPDENTLFKYLSKSYKKKKVFVNLKAKLVTQNFQQTIKSQDISSTQKQINNLKYKRLRLTHTGNFTQEQSYSYRSTAVIQPNLFTRLNQKYQRTFQEAKFNLNSKIYSKTNTMPSSLIKGFKTSGSTQDIGCFKLKSEVVSAHKQQFNHEKGDFSILELNEKNQPRLFIKRRIPTSLNSRNGTQTQLRQFIQRRKIRTAQANTLESGFKDHRKLMTQQKREVNSLQSESNIKLNRYKQFTKTYSGWKIKK